ncbi:MAG: class I SAM-dependent methyltransferase [bacterium]
MDYNEKQKIERDCFNSLVHEKWDDKSLFIDKEKPPFANYSGDLLDGTKKFLKDVTGKKVLEIGCGNGELSVWMAKNGADVFGVDISDESIKIAERRSAENATQNNTHFYARPAEQLLFEDCYFDIVFINVSLHHLEVDIALKEFKRVLKPKGILIAIEPLAFSRTIQNFRTSKLFTKLYPIRQETPTERILLVDDLKLIKSLFANTTFTPYRIFSPFVYKVKPIFFFLANRCFSKEKDFETRKEKMNRTLQRFDEKLLHYLPFLKSLSRYVVIFASKE